MRGSPVLVLVLLLSAVGVGDVPAGRCSVVGAADGAAAPTPSQRAAALAQVSLRLGELRLQAGEGRRR